ncbi:hybrid sensor histidine kinase/response regulator [Chondromyces apiculatus]|uniref:histidine kinase n=1 Tax=Chondromyces apiculatus DSM 436 TaxID=1192034 RepID=A0A017TDX6_9BACT|nr:response regulator [Chondromyces apiculatus]EYF06821.1 Chemotaxis protein methyltransferase CheR [Chondromyces apiculatus DSM 436]
MSEAKRPVVLNVNDDETTRYLIKKILTGAGFSVIEAQNGEEALRLAATGPDLVVLDIKLPDISGYEVCRLLKANAQTATIPVLQTSATFVTSERRVQGLEGGADSYLTQPFEAIELIATVRSLLRARRAEEAARSAANDWEATFDGISDGVCLFGADGRLRRHNRAFADLVERFAPHAVDEKGGADALLLASMGGRTAEAVLGMLLPTRSTKGLGMTLGSEERQSMEAAIGDRWFQITADPVLYAHGARGLVLIFNDVSEHKRLDEERRQRAEHLAEADRRKDEFLAMLAHELRNPLNAISTAVHIQNRIGSQDPQNVRLRATISRQTSHLARLVDDLLDVSRITRGKILLKQESLDLAEIVERAVGTCRLLIDSRRHQLTVTLPPEPMWIEGDTLRIEQILVNLLNNAAKYTDTGGRIWLSVEREEAHDGKSYAAIRVRDTGVGIAADQLEAIFDLFAQEDVSLARSTGGLGIGLTMARGLAQLHGGTIRAQSEGRGKGSEFRVMLPALKAAPAAENSQPERLPSGRLRVLVVEDNPDALELVQNLLELWGHQVETASDGVTGLEMALTMKPDVALIDIGLPAMDGYEVASRLRAEGAGRNIALIAVTGYGREEDRRRAKDAGFDEHLVKPVNPTHLAEAIERQALALRPRADGQPSA